MKMLTLALSPWKWEGAALVGGSGADFAAFAKTYCDADLNIGSQSCGHTYVEYGKPWLLWLDSLSDVAVLAHEALHLASGVLEARGLTHTAASEEAYTYTMEDIMRQVLRGQRWKVAKSSC